MGQLVEVKGYSDNREVIVQVINYGDIIPEEDLPYLFDMLYIENYKIKYKKKRRTLHVGTSAVTNN
ncbi:sensor histidine kinase [Bacillus mycoides]|nr:sensor histidine kinase [Bacillus mycoides]